VCVRARVCVLTDDTGLYTESQKGMEGPVDQQCISQQTMVYPCEDGGNRSAEAAAATPKRMMRIVRKPKPSAGWCEESRSGAIDPANLPKALPFDPMGMLGGLLGQATSCHTMTTTTTTTAAATGEKKKKRRKRNKKGRAPPQTHEQQQQQQQGSQAGAATPAHNAGDVRKAYKARMHSMRASRSCANVRQAEASAHDAAPPPLSALLAEGDGGDQSPLLRLSRAQRRQLARGARSPAIVDAALNRMGITDPTMRAAVTEALSATEKRTAAS